MIVRASHWARGQDGFELAESRTFGTRASARLWAASRLGTLATTRACYWRDLGRAPYVELRAITRCRRTMIKALAHVGDVYPEVVMVPSCDELGWTP